MLSSNPGVQFFSFTMVGQAQDPHPVLLARNITGLILGLRPPNERRRYFVTTSLIGGVQA